MLLCPSRKTLSAASTHNGSKSLNTCIQLVKSDILGVWIALVFLHIYTWHYHLWGIFVPVKSRCVGRFFAAGARQNVQAAFALSPMDAQLKTRLDKPGKCTHVFLALILCERFFNGKMVKMGDCSILVFF